MLCWMIANKGHGGCHPNRLPAHAPAAADVAGEATMKTTPGCDMQVVSKARTQVKPPCMALGKAV
jgi:hypothetical protein